MNRAERRRFDALLEEALENLPPALHELLEQVPLIVEDRPSKALVEELIEEGTLESPVPAEDENEATPDERHDDEGGRADVESSDGNAEADDESAASGGDDLCGLHSGTPFTEQSVEHSGGLPDAIMLFREGVLATAGGWDNPDGEDAVYEEIMITLLHEIGHHFGLSEDDLARLGYE